MTPHIRKHEPGDVGWIISMHGKIYAEEFQFDSSFEVHIASKIVEFFRQSEPFNSVWISEVNGERAGSIAVSRLSDRKAFINFLLVMDQFRGHGIAQSLMDVVVDHAKTRGVSVLRLETYSILESARNLYRRMGFNIVEAKAGLNRFGRSFDQEFWEKPL